MSGRTVELDLEHALRLADVLSATVTDDVTGRAVDALVAAIGRAEAVPEVIDRLRRGEVIGLDDVVGELDRHEALNPVGHRPRPQWANVAKATRLIGVEVTKDPGSQARADELGAYVRDTWDALGLSLYDEETLYVSLTTAALLVEMANNARAKNELEAEHVEVIARLAQGLTAAVLPYLPEEARP